MLADSKTQIFGFLKFFSSNGACLSILGSLSRTDSVAQWFVRWSQLAMMKRADQEVRDSDL